MNIYKKNILATLTICFSIVFLSCSDEAKVKRVVKDDIVKSSKISYASITFNKVQVLFLDTIPYHLYPDWTKTLFDVDSCDNIMGECLTHAKKCMEFATYCQTKGWEDKYKKCVSLAKEYLVLAKSCQYKIAEIQSKRDSIECYCKKKSSVLVYADFNYDKKELSTLGLYVIKYNSENKLEIVVKYMSDAKLYTLDEKLHKNFSKSAARNTIYKIYKDYFK